jgi:acyl-CoA thioesterase YciA
VSRGAAPDGARPAWDVAPWTLSVLVMPAQINSLGVMHGGHMVSWMDMAAWVVATRAVEDGQTVLFKAVDDLVWSASVRAGEVCSVTARLAAVGTTSLTVELEAETEDPARKVVRPVCRARFTMVTVDADGAAEPVRLAAVARAGEVR